MSQAAQNIDHIVVITKANFKRLWLKISEKVYVDTSDYGIGYKYPIYLFNFKEKMQLSAIRALFRNFDFYIDKILQEIMTTDSRTTIYPESTPKYHRDYACESLQHNYTNFQIPVEIREKGAEVIKEFREWFKANLYVIEESGERKFIEMMEASFLLKNPPKRIEVPNSGAVKFENLALEEIEIQIDFLIDEAKQIDSEDQQRMKEIKDEILYWMSHYYRARFNPVVRFQLPLLDQLGFEPCCFCHGRSEKRSESPRPTDSGKDVDDDSLPF